MSTFVGKENQNLSPEKGEDKSGPEVLTDPHDIGIGANAPTSLVQKPVFIDKEPVDFGHRK